MDPGLAKLLKMAFALLAKGVLWWKMPVVLIMAYTFLHRERLMDNNLFDSYPNPLPAAKMKCIDPVLGLRFVGCFNSKNLQNAGFVQEFTSNVMTHQLCVKQCQLKKYPYAGLFNGNTCLCGSTVVEQKGRACDCRKRCKGNRRQLCGSRNRKNSRDEYYYVVRTDYCTTRMKAARMIDGTCNNLNFTAMGSRFIRFGRNFHYNQTVLPDKQRLLDPNPRTIATKLLKRSTFQPAKWLNLLSVAWVQFMTHDWFDHGRPIVGENPIIVPLDKNDPLYNKFDGHLLVDRTRPDRCPQHPTRPLSFQNHVTHWWDASQIYGSTMATNRRVRSFDQGKLKLNNDGFLPRDPKTNIAITGFSDNWWIGLSLLHNIFTREHNSICDMLRQNNPDWDDQRLYDTARLINSALLAKIHVTEWTPTILNEPFVDESVKIEWFGKISPMVQQYLESNNITLDPSAVHGNIGFPSSFGAQGSPFTLTEEFIALYRFHSLLPDKIYMRSFNTGENTGNSYDIPNYSFGNAEKIFQQNNIKDIVFTFGSENAGALILNNYPAALMNLAVPSHQGHGFQRLIDLAAIDIIRDRERGIPRYNKFRSLLKLRPVKKFTDFDVTPEQAEQLRVIYKDDVDNVDLMVGCLAEHRPDGFGFGETPFMVFLFMANRRMMTDRFFNDDFTKEFYTKQGIDWVNQQTMKDVLQRAFPELPLIDKMKHAKTAFFDWDLGNSVAH